MSRGQIAWTVVMALVAAFIIGLGVVVWLHARRLNQIDARLRADPRGQFHEDMVKDLPDPARRYLLHAIEPSTPLHASVTLVMKGFLKMNPEKPYVELDATERLTPGVGFLWRARAHIGPAPVSVSDFYLDEQGMVRVALMSVLPVVNQSGPDVARSSRGRLVAESQWCPTALVNAKNVVWEAVDDTHVRTVHTVDGAQVAVTLAVDDDGRLTQITMQRWGDAGREDWGSTPYGFQVLEEDTFQGVTIPTSLEGGWWYGTDRYVADDASKFQIVNAVYRPTGG